MRSYKLFLTILVAMCMWTTASADDIDVFRGASGVKPNILFVFDRSGSMDFDLAGEETSNKAEQRGSILRDAFKQLLEDNKDTIRAGLGPFYHGSSSGVLWPISDLLEDASTIDSTISPSDGQTTLSIMDAIIDRESNEGATNIVDALYESALYFRGDTVHAGGANKGWQFRPYEWNADTSQFTGGDRRAPHPGTYLPTDAFHIVPDTEVTIDTCRDYTVGGLFSGKDECDDSRNTNVYNCQLVPAIAPDPDKQVCVNKVSECTGGYGIDGQCLKTERVCKEFGPDPGTAQYNQCDFSRPKDDVATWDGADYVSPIEHSCQTNAIVLLSDGEPSEAHSQELIRDLTGVSSCEDLSLSIFAGSDAADASDGNCAIELAEFLAAEDQVDSIDASSVKTYTIGFANAGPGQDFLSEVAKAGQGEFHPASDAQELNEAFASVLKAISGQAETFAPVSLDIDRQTASTQNKIYLSLFQPDSNISWAGNLKGYFLGPDGLEDINGDKAIEIKGSDAQFKATAQSFWSTTSDGGDVSAGGANSRLNSASRQLYTNTEVPNGAVSIDITAANNYMTSGNLDITDEMLDGADRDVLDWIHEQPMADPLHTQPQLVRYEDREVVYTMTNQGLLHAIDVSSPTAPGSTDGGNELWAYMPQGLLKNLGKLNDQRGGEHIYGLDGGMTRYLEESVDTDGIITDGERAILYIGMRRGGRNYYAIDVSDPLSPTLLWEIKGGEGDFSNLGQSWSRMALTTMEVYGAEKKVLIFGGGYDPVLDGSTDVNSSNKLGSSVFIVEADTGKFLWERTFVDNGKGYAVPADITVIDSDSDGLTDRLYIADLGGRIWRVDFTAGKVNGAPTNVAKLADLSANGDYHPFFYAPSVAVVRDGLKSYIALSIGSGSRENPMYPDSANSMFMIKDRNINAGFPTDTSAWPIDTTSMYDATSNDIGSSDVEVAAAAKELNSSSEGWYIRLMTGEKILATTAVFENQLLFTSFSPDITGNDTSNVCSPVGTTGRFYQVDVNDGRALGFLSQTDPAGTSQVKERSKIVKTHGIPGSATLVFPKGSDEVKIYVGQQEVSAVSQTLNSLLWYGN